MWDWEQGIQLSFVNNQPKSGRITSMEFINPHDQALLMCGSGQLAFMLIQLNFTKILFNIHLFIHASTIEIILCVDQRSAFYNCDLYSNQVQFSFCACPC